MAVSAADVETAVRGSIADIVHVHVEDTSGGCGASFRVLCVSPAFTGVGLLARQRQIHAALGSEKMKQIHALEIKAWTPEQWEADKAKVAAASAAAHAASGAGSA